MKFLDRLVSFSLNNPIMILLFSGVFFILSFVFAFQIKMDAIPDITTSQVQIVTAAPSLSALEIEEYITYPVERMLGGIPNVEQIRSISRYGISIITLVMKEGTDIHLARKWVLEKIQDISKIVPENYGKPEIAPLTTALGEVLQFTLESEVHDPKELTSTLLWYIFPQLKTIPGVVDVNLFGGEVEEFHIILNPETLKIHKISLQEIIKALKENNVLEGGGYLEKNKEHILIGIESRILKPDDIKQIAIPKPNSPTPIYLSSLARIERGHSLKKGAATSNGYKEVTGGIVLMYMGEDAYRVSKLAEEKLEKIQKNLPEGMKIKVFYNRSQMIETTIQTVVFNLTEGALLVIIVLFIMMGDMRSGFIIAVILPLCMLFAMTIMVIRDAPANLMSMGAIDFGLLVDGAVIVVENSYRKLQMQIQKLGRDLTALERKETIYEATLEVRKATIYGELILGLVYFPVLMLSGTAGMLFRPMAWTVLYALLGAFFLTLTLIPVLCYFFLNPSPHKIHEETWILRYLKEKYSKILRYSLKNKLYVLIGSFLLFICTFFSFFFLDKEFIPVLDEGDFLIEITRIPSASLQESIDSSLRLERKLLSSEFPEIKGIVSKTGSPQLALEPMGMEKTDVFIQLKPKKEWNRSQEEFLEAMEEAVTSTLPEVVFGFSQPIEMRTNEMLAGIRSDIGVKIYGSNINTLKELADKVQKIVLEIPEVTNLRVEQLSGVNYLEIKPIREQIARYGMSASDIASYVRMVFAGLPVTQVIDGPKRIQVVLRYENYINQKNIDWGSFLIPTPQGQLVPLQELAIINIQQGPAQISHDWMERRVLVEFNVKGRNAVGIAKEVEKLLTETSFPAGYHWEVVGSFQDYNKATKNLLLVVPIALFFILFLLYQANHNFLLAIMLFINMPFALTGGILSLWIRGLPFNISAAVGFVALCGIAVLNSLVLVAFSLHREQEGISPTQAIEESSLVRFRPVIMTAIVAILGFLPMAVSTNPGAEVQRPLATVIIGGLITDFLLTLIVFPAFYSYIRDREASIHSKTS